MLPGLQLRLLTPEQVMSCAAWALHYIEVEPVEQLVRRLPQPCSRTEFCIDDCHMQGVHQVGVEKLTDDRCAPSQPDILTRCGFLCAVKYFARLSIDEMERGV